MNKMFKKIVATTAAVSTVACLSVSAFAATADYAAGTNSVAVTLGTDEALTTGAQYTIIVVPANWNPSVDGADDQIYYINQGAAEGENGEFETILANAALKDGIPNGTYQVRFGTDAATSIATAEFTIGDTGISVNWGDITGEGDVDLLDAIAALVNKAGIEESYKVSDVNEPAKAINVKVGSNVLVKSGEKEVEAVWGDITGEGDVDLLDAIAALVNKAGIEETYDISDVNNADNSVSIAVGSTVTVSEISE